MSTSSDTFNFTSGVSDPLSTEETLDSAYTDSGDQFGDLSDTNLTDTSNLSGVENELDNTSNLENPDLSTIDLSDLGDLSNQGGSGTDGLSTTDLSNIDSSLSSGSSSLLSNIESLFGGGSSLLDAAGLAGVAAYGLSSASSAESQTNSELQPLFGESSSLLNESNQLISNYNSGTLPAAEQSYVTSINSEAQNLLSQYNSGTLPSWAGSYVNWTSQEAQNLLSAQPTQALEAIATENFTDYSSGQLKPADATALAQQVAAQKQGVASMLSQGGDVDSSVAQAQYQQIDNQAQVTAQSILNSYFQTGDTAYNSWLQTNTQAANIMAQGASFANTVFSTMLQEGLQAQEFAGTYEQAGLNAELNYGEQAASLGDSALYQAVGLQLQSDSQLSSMVGSLMQAIATAYSYSKATAAGATTATGTGSTVGTIAALVGDVAKYGSDIAQGAEDLFGDSSQVPSATAQLAASSSTAATTPAVGTAATSDELAANSDALTTPIGTDASQAVAPAASDLAGGFSDYTDLTESALQSQLGDVADDGTAAAVSASNEAALNAIDGGAAGAGAGTDAGANAADVSGSSAGSVAGDLGEALGVAGIGYSLYNEVENWQSGGTGSDALSGAETGAAIGSMVLPGLGTVVGAVIGGAVGAISSAFGGGKTDPETLNWDKIAGQLASNPSMANQFTAAQSYQLLAGVMDAKNNTKGHSEPIEQVFGREGEGTMMVQMTTQINQALANGTISKTSSPTDIYNNVVVPWLASKGASIPTNQMTSNGQPEGQALPYVIQRLIGLWQAGNLTSTSQVGVSGQTIQGLPTFGG